MATTRIEADRDRVPVAVYHQYNRETWTHPFLAECERCEATPRYGLENRRAVLALAEQGRDHG